MNPSVVYVLFLLLIKYISDKYGNSDDFAPPATIPKGASFKDMIALKGMDAELSALMARRDKTRDLKHAMMQELLTGRTQLL
ncbi:hypothetical protein [Glaciimonas sp. PCH181]|uniref:hypothetical protein n=1 Tax=Glaciimonas sp. PCH181 TaxID=2133943 RepID=UPI00191BEDEF|nr:hypothetical protein [Glaciimonas sp. PCH181]